MSESAPTLRLSPQPAFLTRRASAPVPSQPFVHLARYAGSARLRAFREALCLSLPCASRPRARPGPMPTLTVPARHRWLARRMPIAISSAWLRGSASLRSGQSSEAPVDPLTSNRRGHGDRCGLYAASSRYLTSARPSVCSCDTSRSLSVSLAASPSISLVSGLSDPVSGGAPPAARNTVRQRGDGDSGSSAHRGAGRCRQSPLEVHLPRPMTASVTG